VCGLFFKTLFICHEPICQDILIRQNYRQRFSDMSCFMWINLHSDQASDKNSSIRISKGFNWFVCLTGLNLSDRRLLYFGHCFPQQILEHKLQKLYSLNNQVILLNCIWVWKQGMKISVLKAESRNNEYKVIPWKGKKKYLLTKKVSYLWKMDSWHKSFKSAVASISY